MCRWNSIHDAMSFLTTTANASATVNTVGSEIDSKSVLLIASAVILLLSVISGIIGNVLVCVSVYSNRILRTANNALLVNLAVGDLVVCFTSVPIVLAEVVNNYGEFCQPYGDIVCPAQTFFHVTSSSVQLITLVAISLERYEAIVHPFETKKKRRRVIIGISASWIMALVIAIPAAALLKKSSLYLLCMCRLAEDPNDYVHILILAPLGISCLLCVVIFYLKIFRTVRKHVKEKQQKSTKDAPVRTISTKTSVWSSLRSLNCCRTNVVGTVTVAPFRPDVEIGPAAQNTTDKPSVSGFQSKQNNTENRNDDSDKSDPGSDRSLVKNRVVSTNRTEVGEPGVGSSGIPQEHTDREQGGTERPTSEQGLDVDSLQPKGLLVAITPATPTSFYPVAERNSSTPALISRRASQQVSETNRRTTNEIQGSVCVLNPEMRVRGRRNLEAKTAKRASYIIGVFGLCWLPLFVMSYVDSRPEVDILVACIAAMSAALNPIVYTMVNRSFRTEFVKIFRRLAKCCPVRCRWIHKP